VHPSLLASYRASDRFSCDDGRVVLDPSKINDEYCDCADGMDEPGTSACANGRFHCRNRGGEPKDLPSSRVNDGVCDCCDGSDEVGRVGGVRCEKTCAAAGRKRRAELLERLKLAKGGVAKRRAAIAAAPAARAKWSAEVARLQNERDAKKIAADASEKLKDDADERAKALEKVEEEEKAAAAADEEEEKKRAEEAEASAAKEGAEDDTAGAAAAERSERSEQSEDLAKLSRDLDELEAMIDDIGDGAVAPAPAPAPEHEETDEERGERMMRQWVKDDAPEKKDDDVVEDDAAPARDLEDPTPYLPEDVDADAYDDVDDDEPEPEPETESGGLLGKASKLFKGWGARRRRSAKKTRRGNASSSSSGAFYTLVPIRPRWRGGRRSLRTLRVASLRPPLTVNTRPRRLSTPTDAFQLHPDVRLYRTALAVVDARARGSQSSRVVVVDVLHPAEVRGRARATAQRRGREARERDARYAAVVRDVSEKTTRRRR
jgi:protein kinase C substrate 80K-H